MLRAIHESDYSKDKTNEDLSKNVETEYAILNNAYAKVSYHINLVQKVIQKDFDTMMKLHILKGMLMEENIRSKTLYIDKNHV